jgi:hypothetical protein
MPANVRWFERLMYAAFIVGTLASAFVPAMWSFMILAISGTWICFLILLVWLAARRRQNWARWLLFALFVLVVAAQVWSIRIYLAMPLTAAIQAAITLLEAAAYACVFLGDSKGWFGKGPPPADITVF